MESVVNMISLALTSPLKPARAPNFQIKVTQEKPKKKKTRKEGSTTNDQLKKTPSPTRARDSKAIGTSAPCADLGNTSVADHAECEDGKVRIARTALPQNIRFTVPANHNLAKQLCIQGPLGPLMVDVKEDAVPGSECVMRLGPSDVFEVTVPEDAKPGDAITFNTAEGRHQQVCVPADSKPGDTFEVVPPALMVEVPQGSKPGDVVEFTADLEGGLSLQRTAIVPEGKLPGQLFPFLIDPANA